MNPAMHACLRAHRAWVRAGKPLPYPLQLVLFEQPEVRRASLKDRPRRRRRTVW